MDPLRDMLEPLLLVAIYAHLVLGFRWLIKKTLETWW